MKGIHMHIGLNVTCEQRRCGTLDLQFFVHEMTTPLPIYFVHFLISFIQWKHCKYLNV